TPERGHSVSLTCRRARCARACRGVDPPYTARPAWWGICGALHSGSGVRAVHGPPSACGRAVRGDHRVQPAAFAGRSGRAARVVVAVPHGAVASGLVVEHSGGDRGGALTPSSGGGASVRTGALSAGEPGRGGGGGSGARLSIRRTRAGDGDSQL